MFQWGCPDHGIDPDWRSASTTSGCRCCFPPMKSLRSGSRARRRRHWRWREDTRRIPCGWFSLGPSGSIRYRLAHQIFCLTRVFKQYRSLVPSRPHRGDMDYDTQDELKRIRRATMDKRILTGLVVREVGRGHIGLSGGAPSWLGRVANSTRSQAHKNSLSQATRRRKL